MSHHNPMVASLHGYALVDTGFAVFHSREAGVGRRQQHVGPLLEWANVQRPAMHENGLHCRGCRFLRLASDHVLPCYPLARALPVGLPLGAGA